jgi:hypothetical protein
MSITGRITTLSPKDRERTKSGDVRADRDGRTVEPLAKAAGHEIRA